MSFPSILGLPVDVFIGLPFDISEALKILRSDSALGLKYSLPQFPCGYNEFPPDSVIESAYALISRCDQEHLRVAGSSCQVQVERKRGASSSSSTNESSSNDDTSTACKKSKVAVSSHENVGDLAVMNLDNISGVFNDSRGTVEFLAQLVDAHYQQCQISQDMKMQNSIEKPYTEDFQACLSSSSSRTSHAPPLLLTQQSSNSKLLCSQCLSYGVDCRYCKRLSRTCADLPRGDELCGGSEVDSQPRLTSPHYSPVSIKLTPINELIRQSPHFRGEK